MGNTIHAASCRGGVPCPTSDYYASDVTAPGLPQALTPQAPPAPGQPAPAAQPAVQRIDVYALAQQAATQIHLPEPTITLGPEPSVNEWNMIAVGQPVWFWTNEPNTIDGSLTAQGIALKLVAHHEATTIDTGDGESVTCTTSTPRPADAAPMAKSPDCGHTWLVHGNHTVTATSNWTIAWSALGQSGTIPMQRSASRTIPVGQLASVVVK